ncbi:MAG: iron-containing alcohol dehydrogenase [Bacillota bacterium]
MLPNYYEFQNSVKILSGKSAIENIPYELSNLGAKRPIILTNSMLVKFGLTGIVVGALKDLNMQIGCIYEDIPADSSIKVVNDIAKVYREKGCDSIIAVGGGSVLDTAKGLGIVISQNSDDIMNFMGNEILKRKDRVPFIAVPTTAGTGSEATLVAVIANPDRNVKMEFISYNLLPDVAVLDARMTKSLPARITASTGMDALCHAVEAYSCIQKNPLSDAYSFAAINLIREYLPLAVENGSDEKARLAMANASLMAGAAFSNSMVGLVHAIGHACGGECHVAHGDAMGILLPHCMEYNMDALKDSYGELLLPLGGAELYSCTAKQDRGSKSVEIIKGMLRMYNEKCGLPTRLSEVNVTENDLDRIAEKALNDGAIITNPKEADIKDILGILKKAL